MDRRSFLRTLLTGAAAAVAVPYVPTKTYSFLGGILRPRRDAEVFWIWKYSQPWQVKPLWKYADGTVKIQKLQMNNHATVLVPWMRDARWAHARFTLEGGDHGIDIEARPPIHMVGFDRSVPVPIIVPR